MFFAEKKTLSAHSLLLFKAIPEIPAKKKIHDFTLTFPLVLFRSFCAKDIFCAAPARRALLD